MTAEAYKLSGGGNDFIGLAEPPTPPSPELVRAWCSRRLSVGADGLFVIERRPDGIAMRHFNADGGLAELCVNGTRCAARLAFELGWAGESLTIFTQSGPVRAQARGQETIRLELEPPQLEPAAMSLEAAGAIWSGWFLSVGVPHLVVPWKASLAEAPVTTVGPLLRSHQELGEAGANVNFVRFRPPHRFEIRTWERGVEGETLACGSGVLASAAVGLEIAGCRLPLGALTSGGFRLEVEGTLEAGRLTGWSLAGDARLVGTLTIHSGAATFPPAAPWR